MTDSPSIHPGIVLATLSLANAMALLDLFVVNVALHDIGAGLHYQSSLSDVAWVLNAYALFFGALLIPARRFAEKVVRSAMKAILAELAPEFGDGKVFRPNRDVRFSADKSRTRLTLEPSSVAAIGTAG